MHNKMGIQRGVDWVLEQVKATSHVLSGDKCTHPHPNLAGYWCPDNLFTRLCILSWSLQMCSLESRMWASPPWSQFSTFWRHQSWLRKLTWHGQLKTTSWHKSETTVISPPSSFSMLHHSWTQDSKPKPSLQKTSLQLQPTENWMTRNNKVHTWWGQ